MRAHPAGERADIPPPGYHGRQADFFNGLLEDAIVEALATLVFDAWLRNWNNVRTDGNDSTGS
jgi:hypothetical protein